MSPAKQSPRSKKKEILTKKAPGAPKRFKSSYILFFMHVQEKIKKTLPPGTHTAPVVSKKASELWRNLAAEERSHWDNEAAKEKKRYIAEKESYTGPWQVPHTRAKKDPTAPRRNPSAFLLYSVKKRKEIKKNNPDLKTTDISRMLGRLWRETSEEEKRPYVEREEIERVQYKEKMCAWKKKKEKKDREEAEARKLTPLEAVEIKKPCDDSIGETFDHIEEDLSSNENSPYPTRDSHAEFYNQDTPEAVPSGGEQWFNWDTNEMTDPQVPILPSSPPRRYSPYKEIHHHRKYHPPTPHQSPQEQHHHHHHHHHHPRRVESHHAPRRYSPIPLYRETNMFCPSPITRQAEAFQYHQPEDVTSRSWPAPPNSYQRERADPNRPLENAFAHDITEADFDRYDKSNQFYKHDPELDCSPIGSYDEFDAQFDPVPIH